MGHFSLPTKDQRNQKKNVYTEYKIVCIEFVFAW